MKSRILGFLFWLDLRENQLALFRSSREPKTSIGIFGGSWRFSFRGDFNIRKNQFAGIDIPLATEALKEANDETNALVAASGYTKEEISGNISFAEALREHLLLDPSAKGYAALMSPNLRNDVRLAALVNNAHSTAITSFQIPMRDVIGFLIGAGVW
ncbi:hypothetical protein IIB34_06620, partial [PVC group bacterium]|nr:hypothetical protein [PVC group bacterium]